MPLPHRATIETILCPSGGFVSSGQATGQAKAADSVTAEAARIARAYAQREATAQRYSHFEPGNLLRLQELERRLLRLIAAAAKEELGSKTILEIGCGTGQWLRQFIQWGAKPDNIVGVDLLPERIAIARWLCPSGVHLECREASKLDFGDGSFDIVFQSTVFSSILDPDMKDALAGEMLRVLRQDGAIFWYDFFINNPWNPDVRGVGKRELQVLFPGCRVRCERITLAPPLGRLLGRLSRSAYGLASTLRFGCTHYLALIEKH
jgi:ubiquinone/menaquinone biosynthesis C-methylase UbiE